MKVLAFMLIAFLVSSPIGAQSLPSSVNLADPSTLESEPTCVSQCETVYADCRTQCGEDTVRARKEHFDLANGPHGECLSSCQSDLVLCKQTCGPVHRE